MTKPTRMTTLLKTLAIAHFLLAVLAFAATSPLHAMDPAMQCQYDQAIRETPPGDYQTRPVTKFSNYSAPFRPAESPLQAKLRRLVIPTFECRDTTIHDALRQLADQCAAVDHAHEKFTFTFDPSTETAPIARRLREQKITLTLTNACAATILDRLLEHADLWYIQPLPAEFLVGALPDEPADSTLAQTSQPLTPEEQRQYDEALQRGSPGLINPDAPTISAPILPALIATTNTTPAPAPTKQAIAEKLARIRIPRLDLSDTTTGLAAFRLLRSTIADHDPAGTGIRFTFDLATLTHLETHPTTNHSTQAPPPTTTAQQDTTAAQALDQLTTALHLQYQIHDTHIQITLPSTQPPNN